MLVAYHHLKGGAFNSFHRIGFSYKRNVMETLKEKDSFERVHETNPFCSLIRRCYRDFERLGFLAPSSERDLASTGTLSETVALEVVSSILRVDTVRGKPRTWFTLESTQGNPIAFSLL